MILLPLHYLKNNKSSQSNKIIYHLGQKIEFKDKTISLSNFSFVDTIFNVSTENDNNYLKYEYQNKFHGIRFPDGLYTFNQYSDFILHTMMQNRHTNNEKDRPIEFIINPVLNKLDLAIKNGFKLHIVNNGTSKFLGFEKGVYEQSKHGDFSPNLTMNKSQCYIHCNLVDNSCYDYSDVLYTVDINQNFGEMVNKVPYQRIKIPCKNISSETIEIVLTDFEGSPLNFVENNWSLVLIIE